MSAHGRFYHGQTYRPDAVYLVQRESLAPKAGDGDLDRRNLGMFVQVIVSLGSDSRFEFELLYDFYSDRLAEALDVIAFVDVDVQEPTTYGAPTPYYAGLNPALPASFGAIQHAMESSQDILGAPGNGVGYGWGGFPAHSGDYFAPDEDYAFNWDLSDLQGGIAQQNLEGSPPGNFDAAPEPSSLAVFCGLGVLALWGVWLRKVKRKPV